MKSLNQTFTNKSFSERCSFMKKLKRQFRISCKSSFDTADLSTQTQTLCLKTATNLGNFCVY